MAHPLRVVVAPVRARVGGRLASGGVSRRRCARVLSWLVSTVTRFLQRAYYVGGGERGAGGDAARPVVAGPRSDAEQRSTADEAAFVFVLGACRVRGVTDRNEAMSLLLAPRRRGFSRAAP